MGSEGAMPPLQVGGVQEAITAPPPTPAPEAVPELPKMALLPPDALTDTGFVELQVNGTPTRFIPRLSVTVALRVVEMPVLTTKEVAGFPSALMEMDSTGQVLNSTGWLWKPPTTAKKAVVPGTLAVATSWFKGAPIGGAVKVTELVVWPLRKTVCQKKGPTDEVMSVVPLNANAS
jgi:hypothetical protein